MNNTLTNGLAVLDLLAHSARPLGVSELARRIGMAKSGVHRLLQGLVELDYARQDAQTGRYWTGLRLWALGTAMRNHCQLRQLAQPTMAALLQTTRHNVHLSILDGGDTVCLDKLISQTSVKSPSGIGGRAPAHAVATGKAIVAFSAPEVIAQVARNLRPCTSKTIVDARKFRQHLAQVRAQGFATNLGEWRDSIGIAAPVLDGNAGVVASIGISCPLGQFAVGELDTYADLVVKAAGEVSRARLGAETALSAMAATWQPSRGHLSNHGI